MFGRPRRRVSFSTGSQTLVEQAHRDACDINRILANYRRTGMLTHVNQAKPQYGELPDQLEYQEALEVVRGASDAFMSLPAEVRDRYGNEPSRFLAAIGNPAEADFLRAQGVLGPVLAASEVEAATPPAEKPPVASPGS